MKLKIPTMVTVSHIDMYAISNNKISLSAY